MVVVIWPTFYIIFKLLNRRLKKKTTTDKIFWNNIRLPNIDFDDNNDDDGVWFMIESHFFTFFTENKFFFLLLLLLLFCSSTFYKFKITLHYFFHSFDDFIWKSLIFSLYYSLIFITHTPVYIIEYIRHLLILWEIGEIESGQFFRFFG